MLFRKNIEPACSYCAKSGTVSEEEVICRKRGIMPASASCSSFVYDPLKRDPPRPVKLPSEKFSKEDFTL